MYISASASQSLATAADPEGALDESGNQPLLDVAILWSSDVLIGWKSEANRD